MTQYAIYDCPLGTLRFDYEERGITAITCLQLCCPEHDRLYQQSTPCELTDLAAQQFDEYFLARRRIFDFPMLPKGTDFQKKVWEALCQIPFGETRSYQDVANMIGQPNASRAVGMANHHNPLLIAVPCHRVINKNGDLGGYALGLPVKENLLAFEFLGNEPYWGCMLQ